MNARLAPLLSWQNGLPISEKYQVRGAVEVSQSVNYCTSWIVPGQVMRAEKIAETGHSPLRP